MIPILVGLLVVAIVGAAAYVIFKKRKPVTPSPSSTPWTPIGPSTLVCNNFESSVNFHGPTGKIYPFDKDTNVLGPNDSTLFAQSDLTFKTPDVTYNFAELFTFLPTNKFDPCLKVGAQALISRSVLQDLFMFVNTKVVVLTPGCGFYTVKGNLPVLVVPQPIVPTGFLCKVNVLINNKPNGTTMDMYKGNQNQNQIGAYGSDVYWISQVNMKLSATDAFSNMTSVFTFGGCSGNQFTTASMITKASLVQLLSYFSNWKASPGAGFYDSQTNQPIAIL